jgi:hypothetical protein
MGLLSLTLNSDLATIWRKILEENGLSVRHDEIEERKHEGEIASKRVSEVPWRVGEGNAELQILEVRYQDRQDGNVYLILMPGKTRAERQLLSLVQGVLVTSGATVGAKEEGNGGEKGK